MPKATQKNLSDLEPIISSHQLKLATETKSILKNEVKSFFETFQHVDGVRWTQRQPLQHSEMAPVHKSGFAIDNFEYLPTGQVHSVWVSPWNGSRINNADFLDGVARLEQQLFDAEASLAFAIGDYDRVTITRNDVKLEQL